MSRIIRPYLLAVAKLDSQGECSLRALDSLAFGPCRARSCIQGPKATIVAVALEAWYHAFMSLGTYMQ